MVITTAATQAVRKSIQIRVEFSQLKIEERREKHVPCGTFREL